ncbi:MAG TPA: SDR family NAD(P)-dependent oxidoreductase [Acidobacteriota bacterium]|nr:SDR family NAD(P)-dependent oxidoreductase [Acidobacteriota bacterium]
MGNALSGKVAFVTGAAAKRGMGRAVALRLAQEGADVMVTDKFAAPKSAWVGDEGWKGLEDVVKEIQALGRKAIYAVAGVENSNEVEVAVKATIDKFGQIDILVNCAGTRGPVGVPIADGDEKDWELLFDVNSLGTMIVSKYVAKEMIRRNRGGKIVHIASAAGKLACPGSAAYAASKWAVIGITQALAMELAPYKINVNSINPGFFPTNLRDEDATLHSKKKGITVEEFRKEEYKMLSDMVPLKRMGTVEDIADLIYFLVSDESKYLTGQSINITGGTPPLN